jgi:hypothetical protein
MGAPASHLGMAEGNAKRSGMWQRPPSGPAALAGAEATARGEEPVMQGNRTGISIGDYPVHGVSPEYETGSDTYGRGSGPPLAKDNAAFASGVSAGVQTERNPRRTPMNAGESSAARLSVSPSMKMPQESPVPIQGGGYPVPSVPSRSGSFQAGMTMDTSG